MDTRKNRLMSRVETVMAQLFRDEHAFSVVAMVAIAASRYWDAEGVSPDDFCLQGVGPECVVFGGTNRLVWSPERGFRPDRSYCNPAFLARCDALGPLPKAAQ